MKNRLILAAVLMIVGVFFDLALIGYSFLGYCFMGAAALVLAYAGLQLLRRKNERLAGILDKVLTYSLILGLMAFAVTEAVIVSEAVREDGEGDLVIVLGAGVNGTVPSLSLHARLEEALRYAEKNPEAVFVLSGGQGSGESISEAECMRRWLVDRGVSEDRLIVEDRSTSTKENVRNTLMILKERDPAYSGKILLITERYHVMRAKLMALDAGFTEVSARGAYAGLPVLAANYYIREVVALWYYLIFR